NLSPPLFRAVIDGDLTESRGALLKQLSPVDQHAIYTLIRKGEAGGRRLSDSQVGELIRMNQAAPTVTETAGDMGQASMFGDEEPDITRSLLLEKAQVSDYIREQLRHEKRLFGAVSSQSAAEQLGRTGNVIQTAENQAVAQKTNQVQTL